MSWPCFTRSPSLTGSWTILPMTSALTLTWVRGSILPGARTRAVMSSRRTRANCTATILPADCRATFATTRSTRTSPPSPIQIHFFFMRVRLLPYVCRSRRSERRPQGMGSVSAPADLLDRRLGHAHSRESRDHVAPRGLDLHLGVDQVEDGGGADVVLLL